ncbi:MAP3K epsilon kinase 1-like isoform X1 [Labeo rohita]|uniref:non-specific serine/threonine protein kinase n=1 Tax=Labeo rohita TaxID=84645 RepID=A0A498M0W3_LABRO|nr:MAP3K epsilon kinase 1-like isoform X1 [Labeo rohita]
MSNSDHSEQNAHQRNDDERSRVLREHGFTMKKELEPGKSGRAFLVTNTEGDLCVVKEISYRDIIDWFVQICLALQYLSDNNVLHRDINPQSNNLERHYLHALSLKGTTPQISERYSEELRELNREMLSRDPKDRPSADEILAKPFLKDAVKRNKGIPEALEQSLKKAIKSFNKAYSEHYKDFEILSIFFTIYGTVRLGEFGGIHQWSSDVQTAESKFSSYVSPEILNGNGKPYDEKIEICSLGCIIYEMCKLKSPVRFSFYDKSQHVKTMTKEHENTNEMPMQYQFPATLTVENVTMILTSSYEALPETFSEDLHQLVNDTLQASPANRLSVSETSQKTSCECMQWNAFGMFH